VYLPHEFPFAIGTLGSDKKITSHDRVGGIVILRHKGNSVSTALAHGFATGLTLFGMQLRFANAKDDKPVELETLNGLTPGDTGKSRWHDGGVFGEYGGKFDGVTFFDGKHPMVADFRKNIGIGDRRSSKWRQKHRDHQNGNGKLRATFQGKEPFVGRPTSGPAQAVEIIRKEGKNGDRLLVKNGTERVFL
jgi:hypothetical protein